MTVRVSRLEEMERRREDSSPSAENKVNNPKSESQSRPEKKSQTTENTKTVAQADAELRERLEKMSGEGEHPELNMKTVNRVQ
ncbi:uncharacterized protein N7477_005802 [Penicillium maclennaniae]|uniref:uncharacterized protein n=1 Tax=Penicillium maclennaniae TaxID=1343394 RepID=UPI0025410E2F|nr:uncharacterized protein N7477_005802 [Penicillium maclennaniae]KAJ5670439.1 hypothetical protein N7477_005802 [Penicillium maclennaniae]